MNLIYKWSNIQKYKFNRCGGTRLIRYQLYRDIVRPY